MQFELDSDRVNRIFGGSNSELGVFLRAGLRFYQETPEIACLIQKAQIAHALKKKAIRLADRQNPKQGFFPWNKTELPTSTMVESGRPRMLEWNVFLFYLLNCYSNGVCNRTARTLRAESLTIRTLLDPRTTHMPAENTILENINLIQGETSERILQLHLHWLQKNDPSPQQWSRVVADSTAVKANAAHPVDSALVVEQVRAILREHARMQKSLRLQIPLSSKLARWNKRIETEHKQMSLQKGKAGSKMRIRKGYRTILHACMRILESLQVHQRKHLDSYQDRMAALCVPDRRKYRSLQSRYNERFDALLKVLNQINSRVFVGKPVAMSEKFLSMKDRDAAIIAKGQRNSVFGYKIQFAFNGNGYVGSGMVNEGNASDSGSITELVQKYNSQTGVTALELSLDDGYAGVEVEKKLRELGVTWLSVGGSKGKHQHGETLWNHPKTKELRQWRSAGESRIFTLKNNQHMRRLRRTGRDAVHAEVSGKMLAYNFEIFLERKSRLQMRAA
jgi:hypothetical protein